MVKKRRQHYVWRHYLDEWTVDGKLWCSYRGSRFPVSTANVAHARDFYRLKEMTDADLQWVEALVIQQATEPLAELARGWIPHFSAFHAAKRACEASGPAKPELLQFIDETINNMEEDLHAGIERRALPLLTQLRARNAAFLASDEDSVDMFWFLASQYFRTPGMARDVVAAISGHGFNVEAAWGLMRTIFAANLGFALYAQRRTLQLSFLESPDAAEFVTGDQPIVNVKARDLAKGTPPDEVEFYYPLTPKLGLLLGFDGTTQARNERVLSEEETATYNEMIVKASQEQVYARTEDALLRVRSCESSL